MVLAILGTATEFNLKLVFPHNTSSAPPIVPFGYASLSLSRLVRKSFTLFLKSVTVPSIGKRDQILGVKCDVEKI